MKNIEIKGLEQLSEQEKEEVNKILEDSYEKIKRKTQTDFSLKIVIRAYFKEKDNPDKGEKYSVEALISGTGRNFESNVFEWDIKKAMHMIVTKLENEIEHAFHTSGQRRESR